MPIATVLAAVTPQLAADRAAVPAQESGDLCVGEVLLPKYAQRISLGGGDLVISQ